MILILAVMTIFWFKSRNSNNLIYSTKPVVFGKLVQTVSETGSVKTNQELSLNFLNSGKIAKINIKVGDRAVMGQLLAELDYTALTIKKLQTEASLSVAQANLRKILSGSTKEEVAISQASFNQANTAYLSAIKLAEKIRLSVEESIRQAEKNLIDLEDNTVLSVTSYEKSVQIAQNNLNNTKATYQQAIDNKKNVALNTSEDKLSVAITALDAIDRILNDNDAKDVISAKNLSYLNKTNEDYSKAKLLISGTKTILAEAKILTSADKINFSLDQTLASLNKTFNALTNCYASLENSVTTYNFSQSKLDSFKSNISSQLTLSSSAISAAENAKQALADALLNYATMVASSEKTLEQAENNLANAVIQAKNSLTTARTSGEQQITSAENQIDSAYRAMQVAKAQLDKVSSPSRPEDISLAQAQVRQVETELQAVNNQIINSQIISPINGVITKINYEIGENTSNLPVMVILNQDSLNIEVDISESDISKIKLNIPAQITMDAFGEAIKFSGLVNFIEPAETKIQEVIYYKVKINFVADSLNNLQNYRESIKSGMTANLIITTAEKENVLLAQQRSILDKSGQKFARKYVNNSVLETPVAVGLRGDNGVVEILEGLKEGDVLVTFVKEKK